MADMQNLFPNKGQFDLLNANVAAIAAANASTIFADYGAIARIVRQGLGPQFFQIGDQINVKYKDPTNGETVYDWPFNVVHHGNVTLKDGEVVPGMFLQAHYCSSVTVMFDQSEALYYCTDVLPAGTYNFTIGSNWGDAGNVVSGKSYYFTTTQPVPAGGQVRIGRANEADSWSAPDNAPSTWKVHTYASPSAAETIETGLTLTEGAQGTSLGTTTTSIKYGADGINNLHRAGYGYNRWGQSGIRQYLNSKAAAGAWWTPQNNFDRPPAQLATYPGFLTGFEDDFLAVLKPIKVTTALNTTSDSDIGTSEDTYDTFFLASLQQQYIQPQASGVEGDTWEYWRRAVGSTSPVPQWQEGAFPITYAINAKTSAQHVRLRSADRSDASHTWYVSTTGTVYHVNAAWACRFSPACVIC